MKTSAEMIHSTDMRERLQAIADAIKDQGWRRVVISVRDENLEMRSRDDLVTVGLTDEEIEFLWRRRPPGQEVRKRFGPEYERFKIGEFYYLPWSDPWVREDFPRTPSVLSRLKPEEMVDWDPMDTIYAPLRLADGRIVGRLSMDDPVDGKRPTKESLAPLELFLYQGAVAIENAQLIQQLHGARAQLQEYANKLEVKVADRTLELREAQGKLLKSERLAAIGELAAMVGHDLRNPLTGIAGAAYYLKTKANSKLNEKENGMLTIIENAVAYSNKIISDLLDYSREIRLERSETYPKSLLEQVLSRIEAPAGISIANQVESEPKLEVDKEKMQRVFINLIKNAFDAMPNGGVLTVKSGRTENEVSFSFNDTGTGMSEEILQKMWTPLFTTKAKGMGFGLPICKRIVEAHGGKIIVESQVDKGTTFTVTIPLEHELEKTQNLFVDLPETVKLTRRV
jgi:signal transduction histidine kinase